MNSDLTPLGDNPSDVDILRNCLISDSPDVMRLDKLPPDQQEHICRARLRGQRPVSVRWLTGEMIYVPCIPGTAWPDLDLVIEGFKACRRLAQQKRQGEDTV